MPVDAQLVVEDDVSGSTRPLRVSDFGGGGSFGYRAGIGPASVALPPGAVLRKISLVAGPGADPATIVISGGEPITIPAGMAFDELFQGVQAAAEVELAGNVSTFYVSWLV